MDGNEIIARLKDVRQDVSKVNLPQAIQKIDYLRIFYLVLMLVQME